MKEEKGAHERGIRYLTAAKKLTAIARFLDDEDAADLRRTADGLIQRGLGMILRGAREMAALLKERTTPDTSTGQE